MVSYGGVYLFLGPDRAGKLKRVQELERSLCIQPLDRHGLDGAAVTPAQLLALCRQRPAASPARLIVVEQAHRLAKSGVEALIEHAPVIQDNACVVLLCETELPVKHPLMAAGQVMRIERFPGREVLAAKPFAMTDALGRGDLADALSALHDQLTWGKEPLELLGLLAWQVQRWLVVKRLQQGGGSAEAISATLGVRPWQAQRLQAEVAEYSLGALQELLRRCWQFDLDAKRGRVMPEWAVEQLVIGVCHARNALSLASAAAG